MFPSSIDGLLEDGLANLPSLTSTLDLDSKRISGSGSFSVVFRCLNTQKQKVVAKAIISSGRENEFGRRVVHEFLIWKKLQHPNIVPLLGWASGSAFGTDYPCMVSTWMPNGTLFGYMNERLVLLDRVELIEGSTAALEYLHSQGIVHGDFHPANILIDADRRPCLTDFGLSKTLDRGSDQSDPVCPGAVLWAAPELLFPKLYPKLKFEATLQSDIYSLGSVVLYILSGKYPWKDRGEAEHGLRKFQNPPRPTWPANIPDGIWEFIQRCWSLRDPGSRPSAQEVLSFCTERLEVLLRPNPASEMNVVLFGALGSGKSSIINLLAGERIARISADVDPCTERPRSYQISIDERRFRLWDTMGFFLAQGAPTSHLLPYEHAHSVLRNLADGANLILLCADKGIITPSLGRLYWLINDFFYDNRAPIAFIATHCDASDTNWWEHNVHDIARLTGIPVQSIPHACITADPAGRDQSKHALEGLLKTHVVPPISLRSDLLFHPKATSDLTTHCALSNSEATALVATFNKPARPFNVVVFGEIEPEKRSIINLIAGPPETNLGAISHSYRVNTGMHQFRIWDPMDVNEGQNFGHEAGTRALEEAAQLVHDEGGVDLVLFCKTLGKFSPEELRNRYKFFEEILCRRRSPVAVVVTYHESTDHPEQWWEANGKGLVKAIGGKVVGHAYMPAPDYNWPDYRRLERTLVESRLCIEEMLEDGVSSHRARLQMTVKKPRLIMEWIRLRFKYKVRR